MAIHHRALLCVLCALCAFALKTSDVFAQSRPNFLFIYTDDKCEVMAQFRGGILKTL
jgi:hypothetical protein